MSEFKKIDWDQLPICHENSHQLKGAETIKNYCMGGHAVVTLSSPSKVHHTYYIRAPWKDDKSDFPDDVRFVYAKHMNGKWLYVGQIINNGTAFRQTKNSYFGERHEIFKGMKYIIRMMNEDFETPMVLRHEGCCSKCGRRLTDPKSIERGMGKWCSKHVAS